MDSPWQYFTMEELTCHCGCGEMKMNDGFMQKVVTLRHSLNFPFNVTSGYRCPEYNATISKTGRDGPHTTGHALDIEVRGSEALDLIGAMRSHNMTGLGVKQHGRSRFVHIDDLPPTNKRPRPWVWSYQ